MTDLGGPPSYDLSLAAQIRAIKRELAIRAQVYPRFVAAEKMTQEKADYEIKLMATIIGTLEALLLQSSR